MKQADRSGAKFALILGDDELAQGVAAVRRLDNSEQSTLDLRELPRRVKELLDRETAA
jgi:histidyl-tRNA synthetase